MLSKADTPVVILCGGKGTRMRESTETIPKPMIQIGRWPIIWHIMKGYSAQGFNNFILCLGYKQEKLRDFFLNYKSYSSDMQVSTLSGDAHPTSSQVEDWNIILADTGDDANTGRRLDLVRRYLENKPSFMLTYGDGVSNVNFDELYATHSRHKGIVGTITGGHEWSKYGKIAHDSTGRVISFTEKPLLKDLINCGFMYLQSEFLDNPLLKQNLPLEATLKDYCDSGKMAVHLHEGFWQSMDEPRECEYLNSLWREGRAPWKTW